MQAQGIGVSRRSKLPQLPEPIMWIVKIALSRPYTFIVLALVLFLFAPVMLMRTPVDIFPEINVPVVSIIWTYSGLAPSEMGDRITSVYERALTTTVDNIEHIES